MITLARSGLARTFGDDAGIVVFNDTDVEALNDISVMHVRVVALILGIGADDG